MSSLLSNLHDLVFHEQDIFNAIQRVFQSLCNRVPFSKGFQQFPRLEREHCNYYYCSTQHVLCALHVY